MENGQQNNGKFYLKWPWNLVVYAVLILLLRVFAIPVILLLMAWNKKQQPDGPEEGYCRQRTRHQLARLVWAALFLLIGAACGVVFVMRIQEDRTGWDVADYIALVIAGLICLGGVAAGIYEGVTDIRDAFFPEKSRLAKSIQSQLPYPEEAPGVKELFDMVDRDIRENGQWFDRVAVGKEWVLGDEVSAISRIRVVFGRNEVHRHHTRGRVHTNRIYELYILDDRRQVQMSALRDGKELEQLLNCLKLRAPEALFRPYSEYTDYCAKSDEEWRELERDYQRRHAIWAEERERSAGTNPDFVLIGLDGQRTSRISRETIRKQIRGLQSHGQRFALEPVEPIFAGSLGLLVRMECGVSNGGPTLVAVLRQPDGTFRARALPAGEEEILSVMAALAEGKRLPDLTGWQPVQAVTDEGQTARPQLKLTLTDYTGTTWNYGSITRRDVELAGEGLAGGKYSMAYLTDGPRYLLCLKEGLGRDGRITVNAGRPDPDVLRVFETTCTVEQAGAWLLELADGRFAPDFSGWKDITEQVQRQGRKNETGR